MEELFVTDPEGNSSMRAIEHAVYSRAWDLGPEDIYGFDAFVTVSFNGPLQRVERWEVSVACVRVPDSELAHMPGGFLPQIESVQLKALEWSRGENDES